MAIRLAQYCYDNKTLRVKVQNSSQTITVQKLFRVLEKQSIAGFVFTAASTAREEHYDKHIMLPTEILALQCVTDGMSPQQIDNWHLFELLLRVTAERKQNLETRRQIIAYMHSRKCTLLDPLALNKLRAQMENSAFDGRAKDTFCELLGCTAETKNIF